jgi:hypothetical protein
MRLVQVVPAKPDFDSAILQSLSQIAPTGA